MNVMVRKSGLVTEVGEGQTWSSIDQALSSGGRGLPFESLQERKRRQGGDDLRLNGVEDEYGLDGQLLGSRW
jgi:hypothetical protein